MKIFTLGYAGDSFHGWANLGDDIQSLVAGKLLPRVDGELFREGLGGVTESGVISMNGFFMEEGSWPPAATLEPFFFSFHIAAKAQPLICSREGLDYLRRFAPIGCRDRGTMALLKGHGVEAFYSKCISLTLEKRKTEPKNGKVFMVNLTKAAASIVPRKIRRQAVVVNQAKVRIPNLSNAARGQLAEHLLDTYAKHASLVITSKIHCAMPCIAMGIPVIFLYDECNQGDYRVAIIEDLVGIHYVKRSWLARTFLNPFLSRKVNWSPQPVDLEEEKEAIRDGYLQAYQRAAERYAVKL